MALKLNSSGGGSVTIDPVSTASNVTITVPATTGGSVVVANSSGNIGAVSATTGTFSGNVQMASLNGEQLAGLRNKIVNGDMRIAQRTIALGTNGPGALTTAYSYVVVDRFFARMATSAAASMYYVDPATFPLQYLPLPTDNFYNSVYVHRTSLSTLTGIIGVGQIIESTNMYDLRGETVTFSFYAKAGSNFSATGSQITAQVITGTALNATSATLGSWTGQATTSQTITISTTWTRYSMTATIASTALSLAVLIQWTPVGTAGSSGTDGVFITGVQLESGPIATPFERRPYGMELELCQRYYQAGTFTNEVGALNSATYYAAVRLKVTMRITPPTITFSTPGVYAAASTLVVSTINADNSSPDTIGVAINPTTQPQGACRILGGGYTASAEL